MAGGFINFPLTEAQVGAFPENLVYDMNPRFGRCIKFTAVQNSKCFWTGIISSDFISIGGSTLKIKYYIDSAINIDQQSALRIKLEVLSPSGSNTEDFVYTVDVNAPASHDPNKHKALDVNIPVLESVIHGSYYKFTIERLADSPNDTAFGDYNILAVQISSQSV